MIAVTLLSSDKRLGRGIAGGIRLGADLSHERVTIPRSLADHARLRVLRGEASHHHRQGLRIRGQA